MGAPRRGGPDTPLVVAARSGDQQALDALVAGCLPLVYNIVGRALRGHADVDDVVQETLLRVLRHLPDLRDPSAFRSWLVAITIRQVRDWESHRRAVLTRSTDLDVAHDVPDPASDFAAVTILRLGLTDQRREVAEATRWLDPDDQELLALWWLEETGELDRTEVAGALGLSGRHTAVRVGRMKDQLQIARTVVRALRAQPGCAALAELGRAWDGVPSALWRKRLARHVRDCAHCRRSTGDLLPMERLLAGVPLVAVPAHWGGRSFGPQSAAAPARSAAAHLRPRTGPFHTTPGVLGAVAGVAAVLCLAAVAVVVLHHPEPKPVPAAAAGPIPVASSALPSEVPPSAVLPSAVPSSPAPSAPVSRRPTVAAVPPVPARTSGKKGVSVWSFTGVGSALAQSGASWYYTWSTTHSGITTPHGVDFVPMIWGAKSVTSSTLAQAKSAGPDLLGFNEPDMAAQSNMTVDQALGLWPQLIATGLTLGSPAVATGGDTAGGWLDRFMSGAASRGYRVDFITLHWYGSDFASASAVSELKSYIQAVYNRYHKPIWLTEYALIKFSSGGATYPTQSQQAAFVTASTRMLAGLSYLQRYAWFALPASDTADSTGLFHSGPAVTQVGKAFEAAG